LRQAVGVGLRVNIRSVVFGRVLASVVFGAMLMVAFAAQAAAEVRTLNLYHVHTKERLTVTYKKNGRYIPSAMAQLNYFLRDWRRNKPTTMSPKTIDLLWELHEDLGSKKPIHIVSAYRSAETNSMLKRIGRKVATKSQHIRGNAIDMFFPDVPLERLRNSALVRQVGGVGFYPARAGGFVHIDSGTVRHWPRISQTRLAQIYRENARTVGARRNGSNVEVASSGSGSGSGKRTAASIIASLFGSGTSGEDEGDDTPATTVAAAPPAAAETVAPVEQTAPATGAEASGNGAVKPQPKPELPASVVANMVPKPQPKPIEVLMLAAANMQIEPAAAPVPKVSFAERNTQVAESIGPVNPDDGMVNGDGVASTGKGDFAQELIYGSTQAAPTIRPLDVTPNGDIQYVTASLFSTDKLLRYDGAPQPFLEDGLVEPARLVAVDLDGAGQGSVVRTQVLTADGATELQPALLASTATLASMNGTNGKGDLLLPEQQVPRQQPSIGAQLFTAIANLFN
jgi:uncharacterized protein YcbK (DUF882 family)